MNKRFKLKLIDKYIIKKFLGTFVFMIALILSIAVVFDINERIDKFMTNNAPLKEIVFDYYLNFIPYYANLFSPLFVFLAVIFLHRKWPIIPKLLPFLPMESALNECFVPI